jgi:hypothetical protein
MATQLPIYIRVDGHVYAIADEAALEPEKDPGDRERWNQALTAANYLGEAMRKDHTLRDSTLFSLAQTALDALAESLNPRRDNYSLDDDLTYLIKLASDAIDEAEQSK